METLLMLGGLVFFVFLIPILNWMVPDFKYEREVSRRAIKLARSEREWKIAGKGRATMYVAEKIIPRLNNLSLFNLDRIVGSNMRQMVETLGKYDSLEEMVASKFVFAAMCTVPIAFTAFAFNALHFLIPVFFIVFFVKGISDVKGSFSKMQREITKDLPKLIEKMMMALETGKSFIVVFRELERTSGPRMKRLLKKLNSNLQDMDHASAIEMFAKETTIPVMLQFSSAVKIGINSGYEEAKDYFEDLRDEIVQLRRTALTEITSSRPERLKLLQLALIMCSVISVVICFISIFSELGKTL